MPTARMSAGRNTTKCRMETTFLGFEVVIEESKIAKMDGVKAPMRTMRSIVVLLFIGICDMIPQIVHETRSVKEKNMTS